MVVTILEDLPNELWLELFVYFTYAELRSTWLDWKLNSRIETLAKVVQTRVALEISSSSFRTYAQYLHYLEYEHPTIAYRITSLLFNEPVLSNEIVKRWLEIGSSFLPNIRHCTIYFYLVSGYAQSRIVQSRIVQLIHQHASTLRRIVLYFDHYEVYEQTLKQIIKEGISLHTMELIIVEGNLKKCSFRNTHVFLPTSFFLTFYI